MNEKTYLDYLVVAGTIATPILVLLLSGIGWRLRNRLERQFVLEDKLREDRIRIYNDILKPFILLLTTDAAWQSDPKNKHKYKDEMALRQLLSLEYRELGFRLSLLGSDEVVRAYNKLMQYSFTLASKTASASQPKPVTIMALLGGLLLAIRRSTGNESTSLDCWDMLEWFVKDARKYRSEETA